MFKFLRRRRRQQSHGSEAKTRYHEPSLAAPLLCLKHWSHAVSAFMEGILVRPLTTATVADIIRVTTIAHINYSNLVILCLCDDDDEDDDDDDVDEHDDDDDDHDGFKLLFEFVL